MGGGGAFSSSFGPYSHIYNIFGDKVCDQPPGARRGHKPHGIAEWDARPVVSCGTPTRLQQPTPAGALITEDDHRELQPAAVSTFFLRFYHVRTCVCAAALPGTAYRRQPPCLIIHTHVHTYICDASPFGADAHTSSGPCPESAHTATHAHTSCDGAPGGRSPTCLSYCSMEFPA